MHDSPTCDLSWDIIGICSHQGKITGGWRCLTIQDGFDWYSFKHRKARIMMALLTGHKTGHHTSHNSSHAIHHRIHIASSLSSPQSHTLQRTRSNPQYTPERYATCQSITYYTKDIKDHTKQRHITHK